MSQTSTIKVQLFRVSTRNLCHDFSAFTAPLSAQMDRRGHILFKTLTLVLLLVLAVFQVQAYNHTIYVNPINFTSAFNEVKNSTEIVMDCGDYQLHDATTCTFHWISDLAIQRAPNCTQLVIIQCLPGIGLTFVNSQRITFQNLQFSSCGGLHISTSRNFSDKSSFTFLEFQVGLYFLFSRDVSLSNVTVANSDGTGMVMYSVVGENTFKNCTFFDNSARGSKYPGGGGLYIEFPLCIPEDLTCAHSYSNISPNFTSDARYMFKNCSFESNQANMSHPIEYVFLVPQGRNHLGLGHGGGLSIYFNMVNNSSVIVDNYCTFKGNTAPWGAGVFVEYQERSWNNSFIMMNSTVENNTCYHYENSDLKTGGGGMKLGYIFLNNSLMGHNQMQFVHCTFEGNEAYWGGGISFQTARQSNIPEATNTLEFVDCTWSNNTAKVGAAAELSVWYIPADGSIVKVLFTKCSFQNNTKNYGRKIGTPVGVGALYTDSVPVIFNVTVVFEGNLGSALVAVQTSADFLYNTSANFTNNRGRTGGAISLFGYAFIRVHELTNMSFINNTASQYGGAISSFMVSERGQLTFGNCFIQYKNITVHPQNWTSQFYFQGNRAKINRGNNSISAVSLIPCLWDPDNIFCWKNWKYEDGTCQNDISSAPASLNTTTHVLNIIPGKEANLNIQAVDDREQNATDRLVLNAWSNSSTVQIAGESAYISNNAIELFGPPNSNATISLETIGPRVLYTEVIVKLSNCPPGFILYNESGHLECICGGTYSETVQCKDAEFVIYLRRGYWIGYYNTSGQVVVTAASPFTSRTMKQEYVVLPHDTSSVDDRLCGPINRTGVMCGSCVPGYGPSVNSQTFQCVRCTESQAKYNWVFYLVSEFLPTTILFIFVVVFQISVTHGPANAFIFFAQVLTSSFHIDGDGTIPLHNITSAAEELKALYTIPYDIWNLNFFQFITPDFCLGPNIDTLTIIALKYLEAFHPLLLIFTFYAFVTLYDCGVRPIVCLCRPIHGCFAHMRRRWNLRRSIVDAFATFLVLSYTKFVMVSVYLLIDVPLYNDQGKAVGHVLYYDGNVSFKSKQHLPYLILALSTMATFVFIPPLLLLVYPLKALRKLTSSIGLQRFCRIQDEGRLQMVLDTFQGCYKDGTNGSRDCRYFAGLYFVFRIALFTLCIYADAWYIHYTVQQLVCTIGIVLFAIIRPYKNNLYNILDTIIFGILAIINIVCIYNTFLSIQGRPLPTLPFAIQYILIICPLIYLILYITWQCSCVKKVFAMALRRLGWKNRVRLASVLHDSDTSTDSIERSYLAAIEACGRDKEPNTYRRLPSKESQPLTSESSTITTSGYGATLAGRNT